MNSRNLENRRSFIVSPGLGARTGRDARVSLGARAGRDVRSAWGARAGLGVRSAWGVRAAWGARVSLGAGGTQVNLSAGTAETLEENS